jgi:hypothetical protein
MKKRFGITGLAVLIGGSLLILFELIDMINTYSDRTGGPFQFWPLTFFLVSLAWCLLSGLFLFKRKPLLASLVLLLNVLIDNGTVFIIDLFDNALNFNSTAGFGSLILFFALVFLVVALILERKKLEKPQFACPLKTPYLILILAAIIFTFIFNNARTGVFLIAMLILLTAFLEEKFIPVVIAIFLMPNFFNLIDGFIRVANRGRLAASTWIMLTLGTIIFIFAIVSYFLPDGVNKGVSKIKEKVSKKEDEIVKTEIVDNEK